MAECMTHTSCIHCDWGNYKHSVCFEVTVCMTHGNSTAEATFWDVDACSVQA